MAVACHSLIYLLFMLQIVLHVLTCLCGRCLVVSFTIYLYWSLAKAFEFRYTGLVLVLECLVCFAEARIRAYNEWVLGPDHM